MTTEIKTKEAPVYAFAAQGTVVGTSGVIDTTGWQNMQVMAVHGGTGGSRTVSCWINAGTEAGTAATTMPNLLLAGSRNSDYAGLGTAMWLCGSLTRQSVITVGSSSNSSFDVTYMFLE